jgi:hypothetical protein
MMTGSTQRPTIIDIEAKFGMHDEWLDMVGVHHSGRIATDLTGEIIASLDGLRPCSQGRRPPIPQGFRVRAAIPVRAFLADVFALNTL